MEKHYKKLRREVSGLDVTQSVAPHSPEEDTIPTVPATPLHSTTQKTAPPPPPPPPPPTYPQHNSSITDLIHKNKELRSSNNLMTAPDSKKPGFAVLPSDLEGAKLKNNLSLMAAVNRQQQKNQLTISLSDISNVRLRRISPRKTKEEQPSPLETQVNKCVYTHIIITYTG